MYKVYKIIIFLSFPLFLINCNEKKDKSDKKSILKFAVIPKGSTHVHWKRVHLGAEKAAKELGDVEILWQGPQKEDDRQMQIQVLQNFVSRKVDAIIVAPLDDKALIPSVNSAKTRNIPVIIFDSGLASTNYDAYVATDNFEGGRLCALRLADQIGKKGNIIMLKYGEGSESTIKREAGFLEGLKEFPNIKIISGDQYSGATFEKAMQVSQNLLNKFGNPDGIFCSNETSTMGMLRALELAGKAGKIKLVGFDINETLIKGIQNKILHGVAVQNPVQMGYQSVKTAYAIINKKEFKKNVDTGVTIVTAENLNDPKVQSIVYPDKNN